MLGFEATVSALCYSIIEERCAPAGRPFVHNRVVEFVLGQHGRMPDYLRFPLASLTLLFDLAMLPKAFARFHTLPPDVRQRHVAAWRNSRLGPFRDLVRFYESLAIFGWHSAQEAAP